MNFDVVAQKFSPKIKIEFIDRNESHKWHHKADTTSCYDRTSSVDTLKCYHHCLSDSRAFYAMQHYLVFLFHNLLCLYCSFSF